MGEGSGVAQRRLMSYPRVRGTITTSGASVDMLRPNPLEPPARHRRPTRRWVPSILAAALAIAVVAMPTQAQDRSVLIRSLRHGVDFRIRVQAAFALGNTHNPSMRRPLEGALRDPHPAVRAAAAVALARIGTRAALPALHRAEHDSSAAVRMQVGYAIRTLTHPPPSQPSTTPAPFHRGFYPSIRIVPTARRVSWPRVRYVVMLGEMHNHSGYRGDDSPMPCATRSSNGCSSCVAWPCFRATRR